MSDYGVQRCQNTEVVFYTKVLVNDILVRLQRTLDYAGVGLERSDCIFFYTRRSGSMVSNFIIFNFLVIAYYFHQIFYLVTVLLDILYLATLYALTTMQVKFGIMYICDWK